MTMNYMDPEQDDPQQEDTEPHHHEEGYGFMER